MFTTTTPSPPTTTPTKPPATTMLKATRHYTIRDASRRIRTKYPKTQAALPHHQREEKNERTTSTSSTVSSSKTLLAATALAVVLSTMSPVGSAIAGDDDDKKFVRKMLGGCTPEKLDLFKDVRAKLSMETDTGALHESILYLDTCDSCNIALD